ncbi:MAG: hypothetical protein E4G91_05145, partial [Candidatus Zixiibacteriota bacterium]
MDRHLHREELIALARKPSGSANQHLSECAECREEVELLREFNMAGHARLPDAPAGWVERAAALAQTQHSFEKIRKAVAALVFDSWAAPQPIGVRGQASIGERRLRFEADRFAFDLRAERLPGEWAFVAQVTSDSLPSGNFALSIEKKELTADTAGFYQWTADRPPRRILLRSDDT